ncbi:MAG TPA: RagB/SusD family nutrient uptake outer membrane protein [Chitinophagaceae bacterium]|nr:RagB/SusD family nutrient uptake outer membrane protein [Chitinophagaceae bacterium]
MKLFRNIKPCYAVLLSAALLMCSCKKLLVESPRSNVVPAAFATPQGLLAGIAGVYNDIRSAWGTEGFTITQMAGTDEYLTGGSASASAVHSFTYNGLTGSDYSGGFNFYSSINALNGILQLGPTTSGLDAATLKSYLGQAQFLRAFIYFYLVQTYGNIPLHTTFITVPSQSDAPAPVNDIYNLIVQDLTSAISNLPNTPTAPFLGKAATAGAAKWLLSKVYLTRGWLNNAQADFQLAYNTAKDLIDNKATYGYDLWANYADAFNPNNDYDKETIFVSDHTNDPKYGYYNPGGAQSGGNALNVTPWMGLFNAPSVLGVNSTASASGVLTSSGLTMIIRDVQFGRPYTRIRPNMPVLAAGPNAGKSYIFDQAFANRTTDSRYDKTFQTVWLANSGTGGGGGQAVTGVYSGPSVTGSRGQLIAGQDTAIYFSDVEIANAPQNFGARPFKGIIVTPKMQNSNIYPYMKKLADPRRVNQNDPSYRPVVIARFSDVYLIAAEAAFKLNQLQNAADMINVVRKRAAYRTNAAYAPGGAFGLAGAPPATMVGDPYPAGFNQATAEAAVQITSANVTLDFILDERTREFYGESMRWLDLVRTRSLVARVKAWNPVEAGTYVKPEFMLRPIPQDEIDKVTVGPAYPQNTGY